MKNSVHCFIPFSDESRIKPTVDSLRSCKAVKAVSLLAVDPEAKAFNGCDIIYIDNINSSETIRKIAASTDADYTLLFTKNTELQPGYLAIDRFIRIARDTEAGMLYADY